MSHDAHASGHSGQRERSSRRATPEPVGALISSILAVAAGILVLQSIVSYLHDGIPGYATRHLSGPITLAFALGLPVGLLLWYLVERRRWRVQAPGLPTVLISLIVLNMVAGITGDSTAAPSFILILLAMGAAHQLSPRAAWVTCALIMTSHALVAWHLAGGIVAWRVFASLGLVVLPVTFLIVNARIKQNNLRERLLQRARTDMLIGLSGRSVIIAEGDTELAQGLGTGLVIFDLDSFKELNDALGQRVADAALRHYAQVLTDAARPQDVVARLGGDEFAVLLRRVTRPQASELAAELAHLMSQHPFEVEPGEELNLSGSMGTAQAEDGSFDRLYHEADQMLRRSKLARYAASSSGRHVRRNTVIELPDAGPRAATGEDQQRQPRAVVRAAPRL